MFLLCKEQAARGRGLHAKQPPIKAGLVRPAAPAEPPLPLAHRFVLFAGFLTRFSSFSSFAISTSGPFSTTWPFFACKESK